MANKSLQEKRNELALVFEQKGEPLTTSVIVAEQLGARHYDFVRVIDKYLGVDPRYAAQRSVKGQVQCFYPATYKTAKGNEYGMWLMNQAAFMKIMTLTQRYKKADEVVDGIIIEFERMQKVIQQRVNTEWIESRKSGKVARREVTDTIQQFIEYATAQGSSSARFYYKHFTDATYKALFIVEQKYPSLRDVLDTIQLISLAAAEQAVTVAIEKGMADKLHYKDIFQIAKEKLELFAELQGGKRLVPSTQKAIAGGAQ